MLYMWEQGSTDESLLLVARRAMATRRVSDRYKDYLATLLAILSESLPEIDATLRRHLSNWRLERLSAIDRGILRIGAAELLFRADVPSAVAIHEAIQLAQRYGSSDSGRFVNGVLDAVAKHVRSPDEG